jgi:hypothetical protein
LGKWPDGDGERHPARCREGLWGEGGTFSGEGRSALLPIRSRGQLPLDELVNQPRDQALVRNALLGRFPLDTGQIVIG